jgi:hypothetical protein
LPAWGGRFSRNPFMISTGDSNGSNHPGMPSISTNPKRRIQ